MTKLISLVIIVVVLWGGWELWLYYDRLNRNQETAEEQEAAAKNINGDELPGMPYNLQAAYAAAVQQGPLAVKEWLDHYGSVVKDPRLAWIQLDYLVSIARDQPGEARRIFAEVESRMPADSPVHYRIKQLEPTYK
jgi:hypothetical protein